MKCSIFLFRKTVMFTLLSAAVLLLSCSSGEIPLPIQISDESDAGGETVKAQGSACGTKIFSIPGALALDFIPIQFAGRLENAIGNAMQSVPGTKRLKNLTIEEKWYYWIIGQTRCVIVTGDAVR